MAKPSEILGDIAERLRNTTEIADLCADAVFIDAPHDLERDKGYKSANSEPFIYFGPLYRTPLSDCGGKVCRLRIYAESFAANRGQAQDLIDAVIAALDQRFGADELARVDPAFIASGDVLDPFSPFAAYADFQFTM